MGRACSAMCHCCLLKKHLPLRCACGTHLSVFVAAEGSEMSDKLSENAPVSPEDTIRTGAAEAEPDVAIEEGIALNPPSPFRRSVRRGPFTTHNGPWYHWADGDQFRQGVRLLPRHCNSRGIVHGGFLCSFADGLAATAVFRNLNRPSVTIKLTTEFLTAAKSGAWLQGTAELVSATRNTAFIEAKAWVGEGTDVPSDGLVFFASGVFRLRD